MKQTRAIEVAGARARDSREALVSAPIGGLLVLVRCDSDFASAARTEGVQLGLIVAPGSPLP